MGSTVLPGTPAAMAADIDICCRYAAAAAAFGIVPSDDDVRPPITPYEPKLPLGVGIVLPPSTGPPALCCEERRGLNICGELDRAGAPCVFPTPLDGPD